VTIELYHISVPRKELWVGLQVLTTAHRPPHASTVRRTACSPVRRLSAGWPASSIPRSLSALPPGPVAGSMFHLLHHLCCCRERPWSEQITRCLCNSQNWS